MGCTPKPISQMARIVQCGSSSDWQLEDKKCFQFLWSSKAPKLDLRFHNSPSFHSLHSPHGLDKVSNDSSLLPALTFLNPTLTLIPKQSLLSRSLIFFYLSMSTHF